VWPRAPQLTRASRYRQILAVAVAVPWVAWALVRVLGLDLRHPLVALMAFTPYVAALSPLPVLLALVLRRWVVAAVAAVAALALAAVLLPRAVDGPYAASADDRGQSLVVMTVNVYGDAGDLEEVMRLVREHDVDVLSVQELTPGAAYGLDAAGARDLLPGRVIEPRGGAGGSGVFARRSLRRVGAIDTTGAAQPEAAIDVRGFGELRVKAVHPRPPISGVSEPDWRRELREMPGPRAGRVPRILAGDFNGTLDHREIRRVIDLGYHDAADATGDGLRATWPVGRRRPGITIDHVLVPPPIRVRRVSIREVRGSDHRAVIAELVLPARS
jgi:endonuclease/exonuclease/phosphatase (EEP) superfamily protein YafD